MEQKKWSAKHWLIPVIILAVLLALFLAFFLTRGKGTEDLPPRIGYAEGYVAVENPDDLQRLMDEEIEKSKNAITLEYKGVAVSEDGTNFSCYVANAVENAYDMYIDIYADQALTDEIFLSGLLRPGTAFDEITLNHPLETGTNKVYVAFTQVEEDLETIHAQTLVTMEFVVSG